MKTKILNSLLAVLLIAPALAFIMWGRAAATVTYTFQVQSPGSAGSITSNDGLINCGSSCGESISGGGTTTLVFHPSAGILFSQWLLAGGDCAGGTQTDATNDFYQYSGSATCNFTADGLRSPSASIAYAYQSYSLSVTKTGAGSGTVTGSGISCGSSCSKTFSGASTAITLTATPSPGSAFGGWSADGNACYDSVGKNPIVNPNATCNDTILNNQPSYNAIAIFNVSSAATTSASSGSSASHASTSASSSGSSSASGTAASSPAASSADTVTVSQIKIGSQAASSTAPIILNSNQPLILSGKTVPNGLVTLTIHSKPRTVTTKADNQGNWSYDISGLPPGSHYVEASVTDPTTKQTSPATKLLSFTVKPAKIAAAAKTTAKSGSRASLIILAVITLAILSAGGWYGWKWFKKRKLLPTDVPPA